MLKSRTLLLGRCTLKERRLAAFSSGFMLPLNSATFTPWPRSCPSISWLCVQSWEKTMALVRGSLSAGWPSCRLPQCETQPSHISCTPQDQSS